MASDAALVLNLIANPELSDFVDRVAAATGVRIVRVESPSRNSWLAATAVILDEAAAGRCVADGMLRRDQVLMVSSQEPSTSSWSAAIAVGAQQLCVLPAGETELLRYLSEVADHRLAGVQTGPVVAVTGGRGGAGASVFAAALAQSVGAALLVDLDPGSGGIDLLLGGESVPGLRWPDLGADDGRLAWVALRGALPRRRGVYLLSATRSYHEVDPGPVGAVLEAGRRSGATVVCDVPRHPTPGGVRALEIADLVVVLTTCDVRAVAATAATVGAVRMINPNLGLVVRGPSPGGLRAVEAADLVSVPLLAAMRPEPVLSRQLEQGGVRLRRRSPLALAAQKVLDVLEPIRVRGAA